MLGGPPLRRRGKGVRLRGLFRRRGPRAQPRGHGAGYGPAGPSMRSRLPAGSAPAPVVVLVHGGCWLNAYGLDHIRALAGALAAEGYVVWSLEYRRVGDDGGGWPGTGNDVQAAVAALTFAPFSERFDLQRLAVLGHSAGGHLALWLASHWPDSLPAPRLALVSRPLPICPPTPRAAPRGGHAPVPWGCRKRRPPVQQPTPSKNAGTTAFALIHGAEDPIVAPSQSEAFAQALGRAGRAVTLEILPDHGHFALIHPRSPAYPVLTGVLGEALAP